MPDTRHPTPPSPRAIDELVRVVGTPGANISGGNCVVWRTRTHEGRPAVVRIVPPGADPQQALRRLELTRELVHTGVRFAPPANHPVVRHRGLVATVWEDLGPSGPRDYESFGAATASLHAVHAAEGTPFAALLGDLPDADDHEHVRRLYEAAAATLTRNERALLSPLIDDMDASYSTLRKESRCVVHDDLWEKNVVFTADGARLVDPDNLSWAFPDYDLAFITLARGNDGVTSRDLRAFESGYGARLPDQHTANLLALPHRLRWILQCVAERAWKPQAAGSLAYELSKLR